MALVLELPGIWWVSMAGMGGFEMEGGGGVGRGGEDSPPWANQNHLCNICVSPSPLGDLDDPPLGVCSRKIWAHPSLEGPLSVSKSTAQKRCYQMGKKFNEAFGSKVQN